MIQLRHPATFIVSGSTGSGKTILVCKILDAIRDGLLFEPRICRVCYCYSEYQPIFKKYESFVRFHRGLQAERDPIFDSTTEPLLVLDDMMSSVNAFVADLFTKISHHRNSSVMYLCQNLFDRNRYHRTISLNSHYIFLLRNPQDTQPVAALARQIFVNDFRFAVEAYRHATREPFAYLLFDLHPATDDRFRLRTNILPGETEYAYIRKNSKTV